MDTGTRDGNGVGYGSFGRLFCQQALAATIAGFLVLRMCSINPDYEKMNILASMTIRELGEVRVRT
jgi:hypothetical protein